MRFSFATFALIALANGIAVQEDSQPPVVDDFAEVETETEQPMG